MDGSWFGDDVYVFWFGNCVVEWVWGGVSGVCDDVDMLFGGYGGVGYWWDS